MSHQLWGAAGCMPRTRPPDSKPMSRSFSPSPGCVASPVAGPPLGPPGAPARRPEVESCYNQWRSCALGSADPNKSCQIPLKLLFMSSNDPIKQWRWPQRLNLLAPPATFQGSRNSRWGGASFSCIGRCGWRFSAGFVPVDVVGYLHPGFQKPVTRFKTGTVAQKNYFCIFEFRSIKYKKYCSMRLSPFCKKKNQDIFFQNIHHTM